MRDLEFCILVVLLLWNLWRTRALVGTPPWLRDALLRRLFDQLNSIEAGQRKIPLAEIEREAEQWWAGVKAIEDVRPWFQAD